MHPEHFGRSLLPKRLPRPTAPVFRLASPHENLNPQVDELCDPQQCDALAQLLGAPLTSSMRGCGYTRGMVICGEGGDVLKINDTRIDTVGDLSALRALTNLSYWRDANQSKAEKFGD